MNIVSTCQLRRLVMSVSNTRSVLSDNDPSNRLDDKKDEPALTPKVEIIGKGGFTLAVAGAENLSPPMVEAKIGMAGRSVATDPLITPIGNETKKDARKPYFKTMIGASLVANVLLLTVGFHQFVLPDLTGSDLDATNIVSSNEGLTITDNRSIVGFIDNLQPTDHRISASSQNLLVPRPVKVERVHIDNISGQISGKKSKRASSKAQISPPSIDANILVVPRAKPKRPKQISALSPSRRQFVKEL